MSKLQLDNKRLSNKIFEVLTELKDDKTYNGVLQSGGWISGFRAAIRLVWKFDIGLDRSQNEQR